jgi:tRNA 2-thiouridine synthesizing protein B
MLHIIKSRDGFEAAKSYSSDQDTFLFIEDGVYLAICAELEQSGLKASNVNVYALENDIKARGLTTPLESTLKLVDYKGFVALTAQEGNSITWQ